MPMQMPIKMLKTLMPSMLHNFAFIIRLNSYLHEPISGDFNIDINIFIYRYKGRYNLHFDLPNY